MTIASVRSVENGVALARDSVELHLEAAATLTHPEQLHDAFRPRIVVISDVPPLDVVGQRRVGSVVILVLQRVEKSLDYACIGRGVHLLMSCP